MREEVKVMEFNRSEQGLILETLVDRHNKDVKEGKSGELAKELINEIFNAKTKRKKVRCPRRVGKARDEAR